MLGIGLYLAFLVSVPWLTLSLTAVAYVVSIPLSVRAYRTHRERQQAEPPTTGPTTEDGRAAPG